MCRARSRASLLIFSTFLMTAWAGVGLARHASADVLVASRTFVYTGAPQQFTVPLGVTRISVDVQGASGGTAWTSGGRGGRVAGMLAVLPGEVLRVFVGGRGVDGSTGSVGGSGAGGYNGGGPGGAPGDANGQGGGGGGASDVRRNGGSLTDRVVVAGGGGGASPTIINGGEGGVGGAGGGLVGGNGSSYKNFPELVGRGGSQSAGGSGANGVFVQPAGNGGLGSGGAGSSYAFYGNPEGGGGGGGYYGGGGGGTANSPRNGDYYPGGGSGGGGSSYTDSSVTNVLHTQGFREGHGLVVFTWTGVSTPEGFPSQECTSGSVFDGTVGTLYAKLKVQRVDASTTWICFRAENDTTRFGGKITVTGADASFGVPRSESDSGTCSTKPGNLVPGPHPLSRATVGDPGEPTSVTYIVDTYASTHEVALCVGADTAGVSWHNRLVLPLPGVTTPDVTVAQDADTAPAG